MKTMLIDGLTVTISDADVAEATIKTVLGARDAATAKVAGLETSVAALTTDKATLEAKVTTLEQAVKDSKPTPAQLRDAAKAYALVAGKAAALGVTVTDAMDEGVIMKALVDKSMGDAAKGWNDAQIAASFAVLTKDAKVAEPVRDPLHDAIAGAPIGISDAATASRAAFVDRLQNAWKGQQPVAAS